MQPQQGHFFVYIMGDQPQADLRIGVSDNLSEEMQAPTAPTRKSKLVYYEHYDEEEIARVREKHIKSCSPEEHLRLVASMNPNWLDLTDTLTY